MRIFALFIGAVCVLGASIAAADLPPPKDPLVMPAIAMRQTPELWVRIYRESEKEPATLLRYLEQHIEFVQNRKRAPSLEPLSDPQAILQVETHAYVFNRLGDVGTPELIPAIEQFMQRRKAMNDWATKADLAVAQLTIERIQARAKGAEAYKQTMLDWVQNATRYPDALSPDGRWRAMAIRRLGYGIRALARMGATDTVPAVLEAVRKARQEMSKAQWLFNQFAILHFLAQFEDERVLSELEGVLFLYGPTLMPWAGAEYHLEPGEKDPEWLYWHVRTKGMDTTETVKAILQSIGNGGPGRFTDKILLLFGEQAVPLLLRAITEPPRCEAPENVQAVAIRVLGEMRSRQAVELLRAVLRTGTGRLRKNAAAALGKIGDPSALPDLLEVAQNDADTSLQMDAITALGELGDSRAEPVLLKLLREHSNNSIRYCAAEALIRVGTRAAIPVLESLLEKESQLSVKGRIGWAIRELRRKAR
jgi:hypothetical protein